MADFEEMLAAERRRAAEREAAARSSALDAAERWRLGVPRIRELLKAAVHALREQDARPVPVLARRRPLPLQTVDRTVVVDHRWPLGDLFALNAHADAFPAPRRPRPLKEAWTSVQSHHIRKLQRRSCLRTGLGEDDLILWDEGSYVLDPAEGARTGALGCFGVAEDGSPTVLRRDLEPAPLDRFLASEVARYR